MLVRTPRWLCKLYSGSIRQTLRSSSSNGPTSVMALGDIFKGTPLLTHQQATNLVQEKFNLKVTGVKTLDGYDNQNFRIDAAPSGTVDGEHTDAESGGGPGRFLLKISNSEFSKEIPLLRDFTQLMVYLRRQGFSCPRPIPSKNGSLLERVTIKNSTRRDAGDDAVSDVEDTFVVRLFGFIPGVTLDQLSMVPNHIFKEMGETLARFHDALQRLDIDPGPMKDWGNRHSWSLNLLGDNLRDIIGVVKDPHRNKICQEAVAAFESVVLQNVGKLPQGFLHGDYNDVNILVNEPANDSSQIHMAGFLDFDDSFYGSIIFDVGIAVMYVLQSKTPERDTAAKLFLRGYQKLRKLTELEKSCMFYCTAARFAQSLVIGLKSYEEKGDEYALKTQTRGWDAFEELWARGREESYKRWEFS